MSNNANYVKEEFDRNGVLLRVDFYPSADMIRYATERSNLKNQQMTNNEIVRSLGLPNGTLKRWETEHGTYFNQWLVKCIENFQGDLRKTLFAFGVDRAFKGEYNYWKDVSKTVGAIANERIEIKATLSRGIDELAQLSGEELALEEQRILGALVGVSQATEDSVAEATPGKKSRCSEAGTSEVQEESPALHF